MAKCDPCIIIYLHHAAHVKKCRQDWLYYADANDLRPTVGLRHNKASLVVTEPSTPLGGTDTRGTSWRNPPSSLVSAGRQRGAECGSQIASHLPRCTQRQWAAHKFRDERRMFARRASEHRMAGSAAKWVLSALLLGQAAASTTPSPTVSLPWTCDFEEMLTDDALGGYHGHSSSTSDLNQGIQVRERVNPRCSVTGQSNPALGRAVSTTSGIGVPSPRHHACNADPIPIPTRSPHVRCSRAASPTWTTRSHGDITLAPRPPATRALMRATRTTLTLITPATAGLRRAPPPVTTTCIPRRHPTTPV